VSGVSVTKNTSFITLRPEEPRRGSSFDRSSLQDTESMSNYISGQAVLVAYKGTQSLKWFCLLEGYIIFSPKNISRKHEAYVFSLCLFANIGCINVSLIR